MIIIIVNKLSTILSVFDFWLSPNTWFDNFVSSSLHPDRTFKLTWHMDAKSCFSERSTGMRLK